MTTNILNNNNVLTNSLLGTGRLLLQQNANKDTSVDKGQGVKDAVQVPSPNALASQIVARVNQSDNLSASFKREALILTAIIDVSASGARQQVLLRALAEQVSIQEQSNVPSSNDNLEGVFEETRQHILLGNTSGATTQEDPVVLTEQARVRGLFDSFQNEKTLEVLAKVFGGASNSEEAIQQLSAPTVANARLPHEEAQHQEEVRQRILANTIPSYKA